MSLTATFAVLLAVYLGINFVCALLLHLHAEHQAHLPHRTMDVVVHFVFLTAFALPALLVILAEALFGRERQDVAPKVAHARAA